MINPKIFREYFGMYKDWNKTTGLEENKAQVNTIKNRLANLMEAFKSSPTIDAKKKLETEITCWILLNLFLSLIN